MQRQRFHSNLGANGRFSSICIVNMIDYHIQFLLSMLCIHIHSLAYGGKFYIWIYLFVCQSRLMPTRNLANSIAFFFSLFSSFPFYSNLFFPIMLRQAWFIPSLYQANSLIIMQCHIAIIKQITNFILQLNLLRIGLAYKDINSPLTCQLNFLPLNFPRFLFGF